MTNDMNERQRDVAIAISNQIDAAIWAACPHIETFSIGRLDDRSTWTVQFSPDATEAERAAVAEVVRTFEPNMRALPSFNPDLDMIPQFDQFN